MISVLKWTTLHAIAQTRAAKGLSLVLLLPPVISVLEKAPLNSYFSQVAFRLESYIVGFLVFSIAVVLIWVFTPKELLIAMESENYGDSVFSHKPEDVKVSIFNWLQNRGIFANVGYDSTPSESIAIEYVKALDEKYTIIRIVCVALIVIASTIVAITYCEDLFHIIISWFPKFATTLGYEG